MGRKKKKFEKAEFSLENVEFWTPGLHDGQGFRCSRGEFVVFFKKGRIGREVGAHVCRCWILRDGNDLAGYITLLADKLACEEQELIGEGIKYRTFPSVKIGLLATDERAKGAGCWLVDWAIDYVVRELVPVLGVRFLTVDALYDPDSGYDSSGFYEKFGFVFSSPDEQLPPPEGYRSMYFDLKPLIDLTIANSPDGSV